MSLINDILNQLNTKLDDIVKFDAKFGLSMPRPNQKETQWMAYAGSGNLTPIDFDSYNSVSFWAENGDVKITRAPASLNLVACRDVVLYTIPLKLVFVGRRDSLPCDLLGAEHSVSLAISAGLFDPDLTLPDNFSASGIESTGYGAEKTITLPLEYASGRINFTLRLQTFAECIGQIC